MRVFCRTARRAPPHRAFFISIPSPHLPIHSCTSLRSSRRRGRRQTVGLKAGKKQVAIDGHQTRAYSVCAHLKLTAMDRKVGAQNITTRRQPSRSVSRCCTKHLSFSSSELCWNIVPMAGTRARSYRPLLRCTTAGWLQTHLYNADVLGIFFVILLRITHVIDFAVGKQPDSQLLLIES